MYCPNCGGPLPQDGICRNCNPNATGYQQPIVNQAVPNYTYPPMENPGKQLGIVSLILGIAALVLGSCCSCMAACLGGILPMIAGIVGIVLGVQSMNKSKAAGFPKSSAAMAGLILSIIALVIIVALILLNGLLSGFVALVGSAASL